MTPHHDLKSYYDVILSKLRNLNWPAGQLNGTANCPQHEADDSVRHNRSMSVKFGRAGELLLKCHAHQGCTFDMIADALGFPKRAFFYHPESSGPAHNERSRVEAIYQYTDQHGELMYESLRMIPKDFMQRRPDPTRAGGWINNLHGVVRYPYHLTDLLASAPRMIYVVEGESKVEVMESLGFVATCNAGGSEKWPMDWGPLWFHKRAVTILPDCDESGWRHALHVARMLTPYAGPLRYLELPGLRLKEDVKDWLRHLHAERPGKEQEFARETIKRMTLDSPILDFDGAVDLAVRHQLLRMEVARALAVGGAF
jgi:hypothetical protein